MGSDIKTITPLQTEPYSCIDCPMKTTIDLPDDVLVKAKILAAERRTTLRELVLEGLKRVTENPTEDEKKRRRAAFAQVLEGMQASNTEPMVPLMREEIYDRLGVSGLQGIASAARSSTRRI